MKHTFEPEIFTQHIGIFGKTGSGKTSTAKLCVEQVIREDKARVCVLDPIKSDWWGMTLDADGRRPGLPFDIIGGPYGHVPIHASAGAALGRLVATGALQLSIMDMADFGPKDHAQFIVGFAQSLFQNIQGIVYLVVEEAHTFAPKERVSQGQESMAIFWLKKLASATRSKGLRLIVNEQRPAELHNTVMSSCDTIIAHRTTFPEDQERIVKWFRGKASKDKAAVVAESLGDLKTGEGYICSMEAKIFDRRHFPRIKTYDNSATPMGNGARHVTVPPVDQARLRSVVGEAIKEAEANDPKALREKIARMERDLGRDGPALSEAAAQLGKLKDNNEELIKIIEQQRAEIKDYKEGHDDAVDAFGRLVDVAKGMERKLAAVRDAVSGEPTPQELFTLKPRTIHDHYQASDLRRVSQETWEPKTFFLNEQHTTVAPKAEVPDGPLPRKQMAILSALGRLATMGVHAVDRRMVADLSDQSPKSSSFRDHVAALNKAGLMVAGDGELALTTDGAKLLPRSSPPVTPVQVLEAWTSILDPKPAQMALALARANPGGIPRDELAAATDQSPKSSSFRDHVAVLTRLGIAEASDGVVRATPLLTRGNRA